MAEGNCLLISRALLIATDIFGKGNGSYLDLLKMQQWYRKAPIKEAIIELRVEASSHLRAAAFENPVALLALDYSSHHSLSPSELKGQVEHGILKASASQEPLGFSFVSLDRKYVAQLRADGFLLSRLAPYESWEQFRDEAIKLWSIYRSIAGNLPVTQMA